MRSRSLAAVVLAVVVSVAVPAARAQTPDVNLPASIDDPQAVAVVFTPPAETIEGKQVRNAYVYEDGQPASDISPAAGELSSRTGLLDLFNSGLDFGAAGEAGTSAVFVRLLTFTDAAGATTYAEGIQTANATDNAEAGLTYEAIDPDFDLPDLGDLIVAWQGTTTTATGETFYHARISVQFGPSIVSGEGFTVTVEQARELALWSLLTQLGCIDPAAPCGPVEIPTLDAFDTVLRASQETTVIAETANVRLSPSTDAEQVTTLGSGDTVTITGVMVAGDGYTWYPVVTEDDTGGWIASTLIETDP